MNINSIAKKPFFDLFYKTPCMPLLLRLAFIDSVATNKSAHKGGPRASVMLKSKHYNKGVSFAIDSIRDIKEHGNHITALLSHADLIQLGGYAAVEYCGGPIMEMKVGRVDLQDADESQEGLVPEGHHEADNLRDKMSQLGFSDQEIVALAGAHTLGFASSDTSGPKGRWTQNPYVFDNTYYQELLLGDDSPFLKTKGDHALLENQDLRKWVEAYADDQNLFFEHYSKAHLKMSELGYPNLLPEY